MKKLTKFLLLLTISFSLLPITHLFSVEEYLADFQEDSVPLLNEELRKIDQGRKNNADDIASEISARESADTTLQSNIDAINVRFVKKIYGKTSTGSSTGANIPIDNTIPQITEGVEIMSLAITPSATDNDVYVESIAYVYNSTGQPIVAALFKGSETNALATGIFEDGSSSNPGSIPINFLDEDVGTTSEVTYRVRIGGNSGTTYFNQRSATDLFGGTFASSITLTEIDPD